MSCEGEALKDGNTWRCCMRHEGLYTGSPGEAGWRRLYTAIEGREGTASVREETETTCVPGVRG